MNKYTLELKNNKLRKQYDAEDLVISQKHIRNVFIVLTLTVVTQVILLIMKGTVNYKIYVYFSLYFVGISTTYVISIINLHLLRIVHTFNILLYVNLILWSFVDIELKQELEAEKSITPFVRGFFLCTQFFVFNVSSYFPVQAIMYTYIFVLLLTAASQNPLIDSIKLIPTLLTILYKCYVDDVSKKRRFLLQKKDDVWDHLTNELLPTSLIIVKWDEQSNRVEYYSQNKQAQKVFKLQNTEDFNEFSRKFVLEEYNEKLKRQRSLRKSEIKWDNTLLYQVQNKIEKEKKIFDNCDEPQLLSQKDLSENNFFRKFTSQVKVDNPLKKSVSNATLSIRKANSPKNMLDQMAEQHANKKDNQQVGKIDYFIGEHRQKNFEVSDEGDRYQVRIGAYFLNEWFGVISIENESFRERYVKQKKQYQQLAKQVNLNYEYLLNCSRQNIENTKELYQRILSQQSGLFKNDSKSKHKGQIQSENNLGSYCVERSVVLDTENTLNEPIQECSSYLENKSPSIRKNNHSEQPRSNIKEFNLDGKQKINNRSHFPPPIFGHEGYINDFRLISGDQLNQNTQAGDQNLDQSSKNINLSLFVKKNTNNKSQLQVNDQQINNYLFQDWNNSYQNNNNNNVITIMNQAQNKGARIDIDAMNDNDCTPISQKITNNPLKQIVNQISESTKAMFTAILIKTTIMNQIASNKKNKKHQLPTADQEQLKTIKKANLKQIIKNITGLFRYNLNDKGSDISIKVDENIPKIINQDQSKLAQLLFNCLNLMVANIQPTYQLTLNIQSESASEDVYLQNTVQFNNNINLSDIKLDTIQAAGVKGDHTIITQPPTILGQNLHINKQNQQQLIQESEPDKIIKISIKARLNDIITSQVAKQKDIKLSILENGLEQVFAKNAIQVSQQIIKHIGPYSKIKLSFDPLDCTFQMQLFIYSDLYVLHQRKSFYKMQKKQINLSFPLPQVNYNHNNYLNNQMNLNIPQPLPRDRMESQLAKSYNIMNVSEEKFLRAKDDNFLKINSQNVNSLNLLRIDSKPPRQDNLYQLKTLMEIQSPINQVDSQSHQRIYLLSQNPQDKQFQEFLKKSKTNHQSSQQNFNPTSSLGLIEGTNIMSNTQPSYIQKQFSSSRKHQELNSSQEISHNQQRSMLIHNSVSNMVIQNTNMTID